MKKTNYGVYGILNAKKNIIEHVFISKDTKEAEVYFQGFIFGEIDEIYYKLYKIGNLNNELKIEPTKVFITGGYETKYKTIEENKKYEILKLKLNIEEAKQKDFTEQLEVLFNGKRVN